MRPDLGKCVIEAPRRGSRSRNCKIRHFGKFVMVDGEVEYEGFTRIPCSFKAAEIAYKDHKDFSDKLGPLHGYLKSSCGRQWDDVWSDISRVIGRGAGRGVTHILTDHMPVAINTYRGVDEKVYVCDKHGISEVFSSYRTEFYVEPETGLLREATHVYPTFRQRWRRQAKPPVEHIPLKGGGEYRLVDGIWYYQEHGEVTKKYTFWADGKVQNSHVKEMAVKVKRQLGTKELRDLKLRNTR